MNNCCWKNIDHLVHVSEDTWKCPVCNGDCSLSYTIYMEAVMKDDG